MARFPYVQMSSRGRGDPLGPVTLTSLRQNVGAINMLAGYEHGSDGVHNALEVPRVAGRVNYSAGYTTTGFKASRFTSLSNPTAGSVVLTLTAGQFQFPGLVPLISPAGDPDQRPRISNVNVVSATSIEVYSKKLTSALGAGNTWAVSDQHLGVALFSAPLAQNSPLTPMTRGWQRRDTLTNRGTEWNALVQNEGTLFANLGVEHDSVTGAHNTIEVPRDYGAASWDGTKYSGITGTINWNTGLTRVSAGVVDITTSYTFASTSQMFAVCEVQPSSNVGLWVINWLPQSTTKMRFQLFKYDFVNKWWTAADTQFQFFIFGV